MPRRNVDGGYGGESQRVTVRLGTKVLRDLNELAELWGGDRSDVIRHAVRHSAAVVREQRRAALIAAVPTMPLAELSLLARELFIDGRSRMKVAALRAATLARLQR